MKERIKRSFHFRSPVGVLRILGGVIVLIGLSVLIFWLQKSEPTQWQVKPVHVQLSTLGDIELIEGSPVKPVLYHGSLSLSDLAVVDEKKAHFISLMLPAILIAKEKQALKRERLEAILSSPERSSIDQLWIDQLLERYRTEDIATLKRRLHTHPPSLVLAQAAIESGWGTSRFFAQANNIFGVWSFNPDEPRIEALGSREGKAVYLRKYETLLEAVEDYFRTLAASRSFSQFRHARLKSDDPLHLVTFLGHYSEQREAYIQKVQSVIEHNNFTQYDSYELDPAYYEWGHY